MHRTEHCVRERRVLRRSAPLQPVSPAPGSTPYSAPQPASFSLTGPAARIGLSLACNSCASQRAHSRVKGPGLLLRSLATRLPRPFGHRLHPRTRFAPVASVSLLLARCVSAQRRLGLLPLPPLPFRAFTPVRIEAFSRFRRPSARLPNPPDLLSLPAALALLRFELRINVPGPLRFRRLAVPQTSWNLPQYACNRFFRQSLIPLPASDFLSIFLACFH